MAANSNLANASAENIATLSRRGSIAAGVTLALSATLPALAANSDDVAARLIKNAGEKNAAFMRGEMERWAQLASIAPDFTLMQPFGGAASHGFDQTPKRLAELSNFFRNGETALEVAQTYVSGDFAVLVMIERQRAEVGGLANQDWSLRVTEVYRKEGPEWRLVHRHADPLVRKITLEQAAALARGLAEG